MSALRHERSFHIHALRKLLEPALRDIYEAPGAPRQISFRSDSDIPEVQLDHEFLDVPDLIEYPVLDVGVIGLSEPNEVGRDTATERFKIGDDVSPAIRPRGIAVKKQKRVARADIEVVEPRAIQVDIVFRIGERGRDWPLYIPG
jgi:hypothetical protein